MRVTHALILTAALALPGCASIPFFGKGGGSEAPAAATVPVQPPPPPAGARTADALDTTSAADRAAALAPPPAPAGERQIGQVRVALGNPTEPGFWLRSSLVTAAGAGRVVTASGQSLAVELRPGEGAAQLSLPAFRALNLSLTDLPSVTVFGR